MLTNRPARLRVGRNEEDQMVPSLAPVGALTTSLPLGVRSSVSLSEAMASGLGGCAEQEADGFHVIVCPVAADDLRVSVAQADATTEDGWRVIEQPSYQTADTLVGDLNYRYGLHLDAVKGWLPVVLPEEVPRG